MNALPSCRLLRVSKHSKPMNWLLPQQLFLPLSRCVLLGLWALCVRFVCQSDHGNDSTQCGFVTLCVASLVRLVCRFVFQSDHGHDSMQCCWAKAWNGGHFELSSHIVAMGLLKSRIASTPSRSHRCSPCQSLGSPAQQAGRRRHGARLATMWPSTSIAWRMLVFVAAPRRRLRRRIATPRVAYTTRCRMTSQCPEMQARLSSRR